MSSRSRRALLRDLGRGAAGVGALTVGAAGTAAAAHPEQQPDYVGFTYDEELIQEYQPLLYTGGLEHHPQRYYATYCSSTESNLDVVVGFHYYLTQEGVDPGGRDSHFTDREPVYVYVDSQTGEPVKVQYSAFHWYANTASYQQLQTDSTDKRALLRVAPKHHHHLIYEGSDDGSDGVQLPVSNLLAEDVYPGWLSNGLESEIHPGAVYNPQEEMQYRPYWWRDGAQTLGERISARIQLLTGTGGARESDLEVGL